MKRRYLLPAFFMMIAIFLCSCEDSTENIFEEVMNEVPTVSASKEDNIRFMMEKYGFREEELEGLDLARLIDNYQLRTRDYSPEEVRAVLESYWDLYIDDGTTDLYSIFSATGETLQSGDEISRIAFYVNSGTLVRRAIFDIAHRQFYVDNAEAHSMSGEQAELLRDLPEKYGIPAWERHCEGEEEASTGHFLWKLIFELSSGEFRVYDGYTKDMSHLPENFSEVYQALQSVLETESQ